MATVDRLGGNWVIVRTCTISADGEVAGASAAQETESSSGREFWTGDGWAAQFGFAKYFATKEEAEACLAQHWKAME